MTSRVAIAVPAHNEAACIGACLDALHRSAVLAAAHDPRVIVLANNCTDDTVAVAEDCAGIWRGRLEVVSAILPPERANAGWARRLALDAAAERLGARTDVLMTTDADTTVSPDWIVSTLHHLAAGYDAVAGLARLAPGETRRLPRPHRRRLAMIRRYENALDALRASRSRDEPWPRHFYEGGASMAMSLRAYRAVGGAPTPSVGEDKALFAAIRGWGGRIRHPMDVTVRTSARLEGRAPGGAADTLALWGEQADDAPIHGLARVSECLGLSRGAEPLTFADLAAETAIARRLAAASRAAKAFARAG